jgi:hypothetical protein
MQPEDGIKMLRQGHSPCGVALRSGVSSCPELAFLALALEYIRTVTYMDVVMDLL